MAHYYIITAISLAVFVGYVGNIVTLINSTSIEAFQIVQAIGIILPPLGAVMGWVSFF